MSQTFLRIILCGLVISCFTLTALADDRPEMRLITVAGEAEVKVAPDEVVFDVTE